MCIGCYESYGAPRIVTPETIAMGKRLSDADGFGALHVVIEDMNLGDEYLIVCRDYRPTIDERILINDMLAMSIDERVSAYALGEGWLIPSGDLSQWAKDCLEID